MAFPTPKRPSVGCVKRTSVPSPIGRGAGGEGRMPHAPLALTISQGERGLSAATSSLPTPHSPSPPRHQPAGSSDLDRHCRHRPVGHRGADTRRQVPHGRSQQVRPHRRLRPRRPARSQSQTDARPDTLVNGPGFPSTSVFVIDPLGIAAGMATTLGSVSVTDGGLDRITFNPVTPDDFRWHDDLMFALPKA